MGRSDRFRVAIKRSACETSNRVDARTTPGEVRSFPSRADAEEFAAELSEPDAAVRIQAAAPQDPQDVDGYLVADGQVNEWEPIATSDGVARFPVGGNIYGSLGMAVVNPPTGVSPAVKRYFSSAVPAEERGQVSAVRAEPSLPAAVAGDVRWQPDLRITVEPDGCPDAARDYFAEVKAGAASFGRDQRGRMMRAASAVPVLKIRAFLDGIPEEYGVKIQRVRPDKWPR